MTRLWTVAVAAAACLAVSLGAQTSSPISLSVTARALQPGEVVMVTVAAPSGVDHIDVQAFDHKWTPYRSDSGSWKVLVGIDLDIKPGTYPLVVSAGAAPASQMTRELVVVEKKFVTRTLTVDDAYVNPPETVQARIAEEAARVTKIWLTTTPTRLWTTPFEPPVPESPNSAFGSRSVFNGEARSPHSGADFPSPAGSAIKAPSVGDVVLAENLYFSGNTVILDHGQGLYSQFAHLSEIGVKVGERVLTGQPVGKVGATGRVTGPHLHWAVRLGGARVDPLSLLDVLRQSKPAR